MARKVQELMTSNPVTCEQDQTIYDAVKVMDAENCGAVPVVDEQNRCIGIVTDRDIALQVVLNDLEPDRTPLSSVMHRDLCVCTPDDDVDRVVRMMEEKQVRRVPVVDMEDHCVGILAQADVALEADLNLTGELVNAISR